MVGQLLWNTKLVFSNNYEAKIPKEAKVNLKRLGLEEKNAGN